MKNLTAFSTDTQYASFINSQNCEWPNVSYVFEHDDVKYDRTLTFKLKSSSGAISINKIGTATGNLTANMSYSLDNGGVWNTYTFNGVSGQQIILSQGQKVKFKGNNLSRYSYSSTGYYNFAMSGDFIGRGDVTSLINGIGGDAPLPNFAFYALFSGCTSMLKGPNLPSTTLGNFCYGNMFKWCSGLKEAPELPATTMTIGCYYVMFGECTFKKAPKLHPTNMREQSWSSMFQGAKGLTDISEIVFPDTTAERCYHNMFRRTSITEPPILPATAMSKECYYCMFYESSISKAPELPATILEQACYRAMFYKCYSLTSVTSILPSTTLSKECYRSMFGYCSSLTVAPYICATTFSTGSCMQMFGACISLTTPPPALFATVYPQSACVNMFYQCYSLTATPNMASATTIQNSGCYQMFFECSSLTNVYGLEGVETVKEHGCQSMFCFCSALTVPPQLNAMDLSTQCYYSMFQNTGLITAPELPATNVPADAYWCMFFGSNHLTGAPYIASPSNPAATPTRVYQRMFEGCSNLTYIKAMFTSWPVASNGNSVTGQWVYSVKSTGTFVANENATFLSSPPRGAAGIPNNWTIQTASE